MPEEIFPDNKWVNGYRSDIEVEAGMSRVTQEAKKKRTGKHGWRILLPADEGHSTNPAQRASGGVEFTQKNS